MEADLARPPAPSRSGSSATAPRRNLRPTAGASAAARTRSYAQQQASERGQLDQSVTKWQEWEQHATDLGYDWIVERDMEAFRQALSDEPSSNNNNNNSNDDQPEKIIAASDWAPVKEPRRRRGGGSGAKPKKRNDVVREGWAYHISRWPLLGLIFFIIFLEFVAYLLVRQAVNTIEFFAGCASLALLPAFATFVKEDLTLSPSQGAASEAGCDTRCGTRRHTKK